jgi:hypothetical protein
VKLAVGFNPCKSSGKFYFDMEIFWRELAAGLPDVYQLERVAIRLIAAATILAQPKQGTC